MDRCSSPRRWTRSGTSQARRREPRACAETRSDDHPGPLRSRVSRVVRLGLASSVARSRVNQYVRTIDCSLTTTNHTCRCAVCASIARLICRRPFLARARNGARTRQSHGQVCGGRATEGCVGCGAACNDRFESNRLSSLLRVLVPRLSELASRPVRHCVHAPGPALRALVCGRFDSCYLAGSCLRSRSACCVRTHADCWPR